MIDWQKMLAERQKIQICSPREGKTTATKPHILYIENREKKKGNIFQKKRLLIFLNKGLIG